MAPMIKTPLFTEIPDICGIFDKSISAVGAASRCLIVGSSVIPPASGTLSAAPESSADTSWSDVGL
jgi:hypothetical protein